MGGDEAERGDFRAAQAAEPIEGVDAIEAFEPRFGARRFGQSLGHGLDQAAAGLQRRRQVGLGEQSVRNQDFRRRQRRQGGRHSVAADEHHLDLAGGQLHRGDGRLPGPHRDRRQPVGAPGVEQAVFGPGCLG